MVSPPPVCGPLHGDSCEQILEANWAYCPRCGRPTWSIAPTTSALLASSAPPAFELKFAFRTFQAGTSAPAAATLELKVLPSEWDDGTPAIWAFADGTRPQRDWSRRFDANFAPSAPGVVRLSETEAKALLGHRFVARANVRLHDGPAASDGFALVSDPSRHQRETQWEWEVRLPRPGSLHFDQTLLFFRDTVRERELTARNTGDEPLEVVSPRAPRGFSVEVVSGATSLTQDGPLRVLPGARLRLRVRRTDALAGRAVFALQGRSGSLGEVELLVADSARARTTAKWVVGVDFGTAGTSVWKRPALDDGAPPQVLRDSYAVEAAGEDARRFPTLIYVRHDAGLDRGLFIGFRALREWERDAYDPQKGLLVRELKSLLREQSEPFVHIHARYTVDNLLRRFLQELKRTLIEPETGGEGVAIAWNFSLPVLDSHSGGSRELFSRQKDRFQRGLEAAGYLNANCSLDFWTEPFCAAAYLLTRRGKWKFPANRPPRQNDWMLVFDSGGGTTDAVLGRLDFDDQGQLLLDEVATLGGFGGQGSTSSSRALSTFGGERLSRRTIVFLTAFPDRNVLVDWPGLDAARVEALTSVAKKGESEVAKSTTGVPPHEQLNPWDVDPTIARAFEIPKRALAGLPTRATQHNIRAELTHVRPVAPGVRDPFVVQRAEFDYAVVDDHCLDSLWKEMLFQILGERDAVKVIPDRPTRDEVTWVFPVGGNCRVRRIVERLESEFGDSVQELALEHEDQNGKIVRDDSERMLAVSGGTVWAGVARPEHMAPYALCVRRAGESETLFEIAFRSPLGVEFSHPSRTFSIPRGQSLAFEIEAQGQLSAGGRDFPFQGRVGRFQISSHLAPDGDEEARPLNFDLRLSATSRGAEVHFVDESGATSQKIWESRW